jgi:hypothetical protein
MHASIACLLLYEDYVWVSLGNAMKAKQSKAMLEEVNCTYDELDCGWRSSAVSKPMMVMPVFRKCLLTYVST